MTRLDLPQMHQIYSHLPPNSLPNLNKCDLNQDNLQTAQQNLQLEQHICQEKWKLWCLER